ncbi:NAD(P)-binding protein [Xylariomycetidae sp. FL0641]|nr:NAD(P)-binding protein [Xylariomycetidae sp. FL0641]
MTKPALTNPRIPPDSLVLVTGANGLLGSHAVDQLLAAGYRVRGSVRDPARCAWLRRHADARHGPGRLELARVPDLAAPGAWDAAVRGVAGVVAVAGGHGLDTADVDAAVAAELPAFVGLLEAAAREGGGGGGGSSSSSSVKAFVHTGSAWAAFTPAADRPRTLDPWAFNDDAVRRAAAARSTGSGGLAPYMATKTLVERRVWDWVRRERPPFAFNVVLPETVIGAVVDARGQGVVPSTAGMVKQLWDGGDGDLAAHRALPPQWHVDTRDVGLLLVAALVTPGVDRERLFAFGDRYSWPRIARLLREWYPERRDLPALEDDGGWDRTEVPNQRAEELLRGMGKEEGWTSLEDSLRGCMESILELEQ